MHATSALISLRDAPVNRAGWVGTGAGEVEVEQRKQSGQASQTALTPVHDETKSPPENRNDLGWSPVA